MDFENQSFLPAEQPKKIEEAPIWELSERYADIETVHERAIDLVEAIADIENDPVEQEKLRGEYKEALIVLNEELLASINRTRENLDFQEDHDIVQHRTTAETIEQTLKEGVRAPELDVRSTKDGDVVIAHSFKKKTSPFSKSDKIGELTWGQLKEKYPDVTSVEEVLEHFVKYGKDHELILELKDITSVDKVADLIEELDIKDSIRIASLSASVLEAMQQRLPDCKGFILNGGVVPFVTTPLAEIPGSESQSKLEKFVVKGSDWKVCKMGSLEVVFGADSYPSAEEARERGEGVDKSMAHVFFRIPDKLKDALKGDKDAISLTSVMVASNIVSLFSKDAATNMRKSYKAMAEKLGLRTMATTWLEKLGDKIKPLSSEEQFKVFKELGIDTIYTDDAIGLTENVKKQEPASN